MAARSYRQARTPVLSSPPLRLVQGGAAPAPARAPDAALLDRLREYAIRYYTRALAELAEARERARAAYSDGDEGAIRRCLREVWAANLVADRYHGELTALFSPRKE